MKHIRSFNESIDPKIQEFLGRFQIRDYTITNDGKVNVGGSVELENALEYNLKPIKRLPITFGRVDGDFSCPPDLTTLIGCPDYVGGSFDCSGTRIKNLNGSPRYVGGSFNCSGTSIHNLVGGPIEVGEGYDCGESLLESLEGAPRIIPLFFDCSRTKIKDLRGGPDEVHGDLNLHYNRYLTSLEGSPKICKIMRVITAPQLGSLRGLPQKLDTLEINMTGITSLEGCPEEVNGNFHIIQNFGLKNLVGGPKRVSETFQCSQVCLTSLEGAPNFCHTFLFYLNEGLVDPTALRNCQFQLSEFLHTSIAPLIKLFGSIKNFQDSLDYGYFVKVNGEIKILKWKFEEAMAEFGITLPIDSVTKRNMVNLKYQLI